MAAGGFRKLVDLVRQAAHGARLGRAERGQEPQPRGRVDRPVDAIPARGAKREGARLVAAPSRDRSGDAVIVPLFGASDFAVGPVWSEAGAAVRDTPPKLPPLVVAVEMIRRVIPVDAIDWPEVEREIAICLEPVLVKPVRHAAQHDSVRATVIGKL